MSNYYKIVFKALIINNTNGILKTVINIIIVQKCRQLTALMNDYIMNDFNEYKCDLTRMGFEMSRGDSK